MGTEIKNTWSLLSSKYRLVVTVNWPVPVAERSKAPVYGRSLAGIAGSNPAGGMDVCLLCVYQVEVSATG